MAKNPLTGLIGTIVPIIIIIAIIIVAIKFQTDIGNFISKLSRTDAERASDDAKRVEEKRKDENGLFDNIVEFFFGKPTEDTPSTDDGVSKNDVDQNSATQSQRASKAQSFSDAQLVEEIAQQNSQTNESTGGFQGSSVGVSDTITATVIRGSNSKSPARKGRNFKVNLGGSGTGSRITATPEGLVVTRSGGGQSSSRASRGGSRGSSVGVSDRITATVIRKPSPSRPTRSSISARPKGNLSRQSQRLNTKTRGASRFNR